MDPNNVMTTQNQIRENSEDLQKYLLDLDSWEKEMKKKEEDFILLRTTSEELDIPPVRNVLYRSKKKNRHKKPKDKNDNSKTQIIVNGDQSIENIDNGAEYREESEEMAHADDLAENNSDHEDEIEILRKRQSAYLHKEKGNEFFKKGNYDSAINSYTAGIMLDPENPLLLANRAMSFLKKEQFQAAENDCNLSLSFDPTYVKAYLRRGTARKNLNKISLAKEDFLKALEIEPENKQAQLELKQVTEKSDAFYDNIPDRDDTEVQELQPQLSGNNFIKRTEEKLEVEQSSEFFNVDNFCIFPDSISIMPMESSISKSNLVSSISKSNLVSSISKSNLETEIEVDTKEVGEDIFLKTVEERMDSLKNPSNLSSEIEAFNVDFEIPLPPVPNTSFQFIADWNEISQSPELQYKYLKQFPPHKLPVVFKHYMEPVIFPTLLETLCSSFLRNGDDVFDYIKYLADIGRFNTTLMFLSEKEEADLKTLLDYVKSSNRPESEIEDILKKYRA